MRMMGETNDNSKATLDSWSEASESYGPKGDLDTEISDLALVEAVRAGDESAFEELFNRHKLRVSLIASRFFRQRESIEEIIQEVFTKAYFALGDFSNQQESSFASWIARISFNTCYDELRRTKRRSESAFEELSEGDTISIGRSVHALDAGADIESTAISRDLVGKLMSRISAEDRLVLVMLYVEGMSVSEISAMTKWSQSKVKVRMHRARASLRRILKKYL